MFWRGLHTRGLDWGKALTYDESIKKDKAPEQGLVWKEDEEGLMTHDFIA